jgi:hypothetical protein
MFKHPQFLVTCCCGEKGRRLQYNTTNYFQFCQQILIYTRHKVGPEQQTEDAWSTSAFPQMEMNGQLKILATLDLVPIRLNIRWAPVGVNMMANRKLLHLSGVQIQSSNL